MMALYFTAFLMGLTGSLHCAGMCGPIMLFLPFNQLQGLRKILGISVYHFCRISAYALMALIIYSFRSAFDPKLQQYISIVLGGIFLIAGLVSFLPYASGMKINLPWAGFVKNMLGRYISVPSPWAVAISGFLNGLLPCGLVYMALSATLALHSTVQAISFIYVFGLGTMPVLIGIIQFKNKIAFFKSPSLGKLTPVIVFFFGCLFLLRGLNLGIPYLSPKAHMSSNGVIHSCCHRMQH